MLMTSPSISFHYINQASCLHSYLIQVFIIVHLEYEGAISKMSLQTVLLLVDLEENDKDFLGGHRADSASTHLSGFYS